MAWQFLAENLPHATATAERDGDGLVGVWTGQHPPRAGEATQEVHAVGAGGQRAVLAALPVSQSRSVPGHRRAE